MPIKAFIGACLCMVSLQAYAAPPMPWDLDPYRVKIWIVVDNPERVDFPSLIGELNEAFYQSPGAAWRATIERAPEKLRSIIYRDFDALTYDALIANDYVLAMKRTHEFASSVRSIATAGEKLEEIIGNPTSIRMLKQASDDIPNSNWQAVKDRMYFDEEARLHIENGLYDGSDAIIHFTDLFTSRLKNALSENEDWEDVADTLSLTETGSLLYVPPGTDAEQGHEIPIDLLLRPIRAALENDESWDDFKKQWSLDEDETLYLQLPGVNLNLPLPDRVFKDFYLKSVRADGVKTPDGAVGLDNRQQFVNQQVLIDTIRQLLIEGDGWKAFGTRLKVEPKGTLFLEKTWVEPDEEEEDKAVKRKPKSSSENPSPEAEKPKDPYGALILPRGIAMSLDPPAKIIDPKPPGAFFPIVDTPDKLFIVKVRTEYLPFEISVRELDCPMRLMGPIIKQESTGTMDLSGQVAGAVLEAFAPVIRLEKVNKKDAVGRVRAGGRILKKANSLGASLSNLPIPEPPEEKADEPKKPGPAKPTEPPKPPPGVLVGSVTESDLESGDVIRLINGVRVDSLDDLNTQLDKMVVGWPVRLDVLREGKRIKVNTTVSAGDWVYDRSSPAAINVGDFLQPVIRRIDSYGNPIMLEIVDFAYLRLDKLDRAYATMYAWAGRVGTLQGRSDRRTTRVALKTRPAHENTVVRLHAQREPDKPLIGYDVFDKNIDTGKMKLAGRSDWDGRIWVEKNEMPLRLLYVKNGRQVIARLPVLPGQSVREVADIPGDDARLRVEAYLKGIENSIVDMVAIRTLLMARIRLRMDKKDVKGARELLDALRAQPSRTLISTDMEKHVKIFQNKNRIVQGSIDRMFKKTFEMLEEHISDQDIFDLEREVLAAEK